MPLLAIPFPVVDPVLVEVGPLSIRWYALAYIVAILFAWWYVRRMAAYPRLWGAAGPALTPRHVDDFVVWGTIGIVVGGRLGYVLVYDLAKFAADPVQIFALWEGGMSFHGGFIGAMVAMILFARLKKIPVWSMIDVIATAAPAGLLLGRTANFINAELYGRASDLPWAMIFPTDPLGIPRHPSQLYEGFLEGIVLFAILWFLVYRRGKLKIPGFMAGAFTAGYGTFRTIGEFFREPDIQIGFLAGGLTMGMLLSIPMILAGIIAMVWSTRRAAQPAA